MAKIGTRTNRTREVERPPKLVRPVSAAFWAEIMRMAVKPKASATRPSRKKAQESSTASKPASLSPAAPPVKQPPLSQPPANRVSPSEASLAGPAGAKGYNNHNNNRGYNRPAAEPSKPAVPPRSSDRNPPANTQPAQGSSSSGSRIGRPSNSPPPPGRPAPADRPTPDGQTQNGTSKGGQVTPNRFSADRPGGHSAVPNRSGAPPAAQEPKTPPAQNAKGIEPAIKAEEPTNPRAAPPQAEPEVKPEIQQPNVLKSNSLQSGADRPMSDSAPAQKPAEKQPAVDPQPQNPGRMDLRQAPPDVTRPQESDHTPVNGAEKEKPLDSRPAPATNGKAPVDGVKPHNGNGSSGSSSLFRSGAYSGMTSFRSRPSPVNPDQIPLINPGKPAGMEHTPTKNGNGKSVELPAAPNNPARLNSASPQSSRPAAQRQPLLKYMLHQHPELPAQSAIFGVSEDNLPVLIDLSDPMPGAVLAVSDERQAELDLLETVVASLAVRNSARGVQFLIFSCDPQAWSEWITSQGFARHCLAVVDSEDDSIREWILQLADWTEQRRLGQRSGPPVVLIMDTLNFLSRLEYDVRLNFEWMAKEGPEAQIWPVAAISGELARALSVRRMLRAFQTRIMGYLGDPADYALLAKMDEQSAASFGQPGQFAVQLGEDWLRFRLLSLK